MEFETKQFGSRTGGGGDFDSAPYAIAPNNWINMENCRTLTTDAGVTEVVESIGSNVLINNLNLPAGNNIQIGSATDEPNNRFVFFVWNSNGNHAIFVYDLSVQVIYVALLNSQVTGGLNFDKNFPIHSAKVVNGNVYWVNDTLNQPRRFNINAAINLNQPGTFPSVQPYTSPLSQSVIAMIRRQPGLPPTQTKLTDPAYTSNFIAKEAFMFCYRYVYRDFEISTLSGESTLANFNADADLFNYIKTSIPFSEQIDQDVIQIDLVAIYLQTGVFYIVQSWRTSVPADAAAIAAHNSGTTQLSYNFYNDKTGIVLDAAYSVKPFDSVPIFSLARETAKNRNFLGDNIVGYTAPSTTSLVISFNTTQFNPNVVTTISGEWFIVKYKDLSLVSYTRYVLRTTVPLGPISPHPVYFYAWNGTVPPYPISVNQSDLTYIGSSPFDIPPFYGQPGFIWDSITDSGSSSIVNTGVVTPPTILGKAFKSDATYQLGDHFLDFAGRKTGEGTNTTLIASIPDTGLLNDQFVTVINWSLSNANALAEIPNDAFYYSIDISKCLRTRFFLQCVGQVIYAAKDANNLYTFTTTAFTPDLAGVAIDITLLQSHSMGYQFSQGDIVKLVIGTTEYIMNIIDQSGKFIVCQLKNVGSLATVVGLYEIYTPYKRQSNEPFYEVQQIYPIVNPGTPSRKYSVTSGVIQGDIYLIQRTNNSSNYIAEAMNLNDKFYKLWFTDSGRPNFLDFIGQAKRQTSIAFSNTFIPGTQNNGLSTFDALDTAEVYPECGPIRKLQLTSKVEGQQGTIMLAICEQETASLYLSETQVLSAVQNAFIAQATGVIGTINVLKGSFGTTNPESVFEFRGNVFWLNTKNGKYIQYSGNGLFPISNYKATRFWKLWSDKYLMTNYATIESFGSRPFVFSCVDPHNWELLVSIPQLTTDPPKGYLPDYPTVVYPFDILDFRAKSMVYKLVAEPNHWSGAYNIPAEGYVSIQNKVFAFKNGQLYQNNSTASFGNFFGVPYKSRIMFIGNVFPNDPKMYNNIEVSANLRPSLTYFRSEPSMNQVERFDLSEQASDLLDFDYNVKEGKLYSVIYRNKLQPTSSGLNFGGLINGEKIRAITLKVLMEFSPIGQPVQLRFVNLGFSMSRGSQPKKL